MAGLERLEPTAPVLETVLYQLNYTPPKLEQVKESNPLSQLGRLDFTTKLHP